MVQSFDGTAAFIDYVIAWGSTVEENDKRLKSSA
jgi:hypothetical protein